MSLQGFNYSLLGSLLLHCGVAYCGFSTNWLSSKHPVVINSPMISIAITNAVLEQQVNNREMIHHNAGGLVSSPAQVENALIKVDKTASKTHNHAARKATQQKELKKKWIKTADREKSKKNDEENQPAKPGDSQAEAQALGRQGHQQTSVEGNDSDSLNQAYLDQVRQEIERHRQYPRRAKKMQIEANIMVNLQITARGNLINVSIVSSPNSELFSQAIQDAIKRYKSVGPRPPGVKEFSRVELRFELNG